jgi:hypothetical protein
MLAQSSYTLALNYRFAGFLDCMKLNSNLLTHFKSPTPSQTL